MDKSIFGEYSKVNLSSCQEESESILDKIFTNNPNFWYTSQPYYNTGTQDGFEMVRHILQDKIKIYEYKYDIPENPKEDSKLDELLFSRYYEWSRAKYIDLALIFWRANKFLNTSGHSLLNIGSPSRRYLQIMKNTYDELDFNTQITDYVSLSEFFKNPNNYSPLDEQITVYWGKCEANQILGDLMKGLKYSMMFPYTEDEDMKLSCYLLEYDDELIEEYKNKIMNAFELFIKNKKL